MKTCDEMVNSLLERRAKHLTAQKKKKRVLVSTATSLCVVALVGIAVWQMPDEASKPPVVSQGTKATQTMQSGTTQPTKVPEPTYNIVWADPDDDLSNGEVAVDSQMGKTVEWGLKKALEKLPENTKVAIAAYPYLLDRDFVWNGKPLQEYSDAFDQERSLLNKLTTLIKIGDELKCGEALLTGTPDGRKWSKELYEKTIEYYGEEILSQYIVDGEFLRDKLEADIETITNEESAYGAYESACAAYYACALAEAEKQSKAQGIDYDSCNSKESGCIILFVNAEEFDAFTMKKIENWCFCLARKDANNRWMDDAEGDFVGGNI